MTPAMHDPASEERARIVTWLRDGENAGEGAWWVLYKHKETVEPITAYNAGDVLANAIERGDHLRPYPAGGGHGG